METETVKSLEEFEKKVREIREKANCDNLIFRGQSDSSWNIASSAYRYIKGLYPALNITPKIMEFFKSDVQNGLNQLRKYEGGDIGINDGDEMMCMLQHLGGKSVFIDFSENELISLYFACEKFANEKDGIVFIMEHKDDGHIYNSIGEPVGEYKKVELPPNNDASARLKVQNSCFLNPTQCTVIQNNPNVQCIKIDKGCKENILNDLDSKKGISHDSVYPDFWGYMSRQTIDGSTHDFKSIAFREISQKIKDGCASEMNDVLKTLQTLNNICDQSENSYNDEQRIKYLKVQALTCDLKYDDALSILDTIKDYEYIEFDRRNDQKKYLQSEDFDPIEPIFIVDFEKAKCYMGKKEYSIALDKYLCARKTIDNLLKNSQNDATYKKLKAEIYKNLATNLVMQNRSNLSLALSVLYELGDYESTRPNEAALYMIAEEWDDAISILRQIKGNDYATSLLARCYMELSKRGNKEMYLREAIKASEEAKEILKNKNISGEYIQKTNGHDHYYKLAVANQELGEIEEAVKYYKKLANGVFCNEEAKHDLAYIKYKNIDYFEREKRRSPAVKNDENSKVHNNEESNAIMIVYKEIVENFFDAITNSRVEKNPRNFNDLGRLLIDISKDDTCNDIKELVSLMEDKIKNLLRNGLYIDSVQTEMKIIVDYVLNNNSNNQKLLLVAKHFFKIADLINRKDAFANKNLGDIYYNDYLNAIGSEREKHESGEKALKRYILANSYYLVDGKKCSEIENRILELEGFLKRKILEVNE